MKNNIIEFFTVDKYKDLIPEPYPASKKFPSWFANTEVVTKKSKCPFGFLHNDNKSLQLETNITGCPGLIDFLSTGYIVPSWNNFIFRNDGGRLYINWEHWCFNENYTLHSSENQISGLNEYEQPNYDGFSKLDSPWFIKTSPGVSCLITHPIWHREKRFTSVTGIMHTDQCPMPLKWFFEWNTEIEDDMESSVIPVEQLVSKGSPVVLVIPFVRKTFESKINYLEEKDMKTLKDRTGVLTHDWLGNSAYNQFRKGIMKRFL